MKLSLESECKHQSKIILKQIPIHHYTNFFKHLLKLHFLQACTKYRCQMIRACCGCVPFGERSGREEDESECLMQFIYFKTSWFYFCSLYINSNYSWHFPVPYFCAKIAVNFLKKWFPALINFWYNEMSSDCLFSILHTHTHTHTH